MRKTLEFGPAYLPFSRCRSPQFPVPASGTESLKCIEGRTSRQTTCQMFTPHLNLARSDPLAELAQRRPCFVHVTEQQEALPGDVPLLQGFQCLLAQGRRVGHVLVVLRDLPTQDHVAAIIHLGVRGGWRGQRAPDAKLAHLLYVIQSPRARPARQILAGDENREQTEPKQTEQQHLRDHSIADGAADVVEVDVDAIGTALPELGCNIVLVVVDGR